MTAPDHVKDLDRQTDLIFETGVPSTDGRLSSGRSVSSHEAWGRKLDNGLKIVGERAKVKLGGGIRRIIGLMRRSDFVAHRVIGRLRRLGRRKDDHMTSQQTSLTMPDDGRTIRCLVDDGAGPTLIWLGGFRSDMTGSKAEAVAAWGRANGRKVVRFDYSGHGVSDGAFEKGRIGRWLAEARAVIAAEAGDEFLVVGSSMGGWMALLVAAGRPNGLRGVVLVAPAPDFTEKLFYPALPADLRARVDAGEPIDLPGAYGDPGYRLEAGFFADGRAHNLLDTPLKLGVPVTILQGMADATVPYAHALRIVDRLVDDDVVLTLVKDGDHRLSRPEDIERMLGAVERITDA